MAGSDPSFVPADFRASIRAAMEMGMPQDDAEKLQWHFGRIKTYANPDPASLPYDWTAPPTSDNPEHIGDPLDPVIVDYALEYAAGASTDTEVGRFDISHIIVTLLDEDWVVVKDADFAKIVDTVYDVQFIGPPTGMFNVTVYTVYLLARDEA